jgi:hypothetical protein
LTFSYVTILKLELYYSTFKWLNFRGTYNNTKTIEKEVEYVTWTGFQTKDNKEKREIVLGLLNKD